METVEVATAALLQNSWLPTAVWLWEFLGAGYNSG